MSDLSGKRILILQQRGWGLNIGHALAKRLQKEGCRLAALTFKPGTHRFVLEQKDVSYDLIVNNDEMLGDPIGKLGADPLTLDEVCRGLGVETVWPFIYTLREYVLSYGDKFYYGYKQTASDEEIVAYTKACYRAIERIFADFKPDLILTPNFVGLMHIMLKIYAQRHGVKMFGVTDSKVKDVYNFTYSPFDDEGPFFERLAELNDGTATSPNAEKAKAYIAEFRRNFIQPMHAIKPGVKPPLVKRLRRRLGPLREIANWYASNRENYLELTGITIDHRPPRIILRDYFCRNKYTRYMETLRYDSLDDFPKRAYFPLQYQPEASIDVFGTRFNNQIETIRQIAMSLPGDYTLIVKEHPGMVGLRSPSAVEKIRRTPNVKFIDYRTPSDVILKKVDLIISVNGTTLAEAAFYHKPGIQLGNLGTTLALPNVFKHTDMTTLPGKILNVLARDLRTEKDYDRRLENFVAAAYDAGFGIDYVTLWERGVKNDENLWRLYKKEIERVLKAD